jgi:hypothetical protein
MGHRIPSIGEKEKSFFEHRRNLARNVRLQTHEVVGPRHDQLSREAGDRSKDHHDTWVGLKRKCLRFTSPGQLKLRDDGVILQGLDCLARSREARLEERHGDYSGRRQVSPVSSFPASRC